MSTLVQRTRSIATAVTIGIAVVIAGQSRATTLDIADVPLFLQTGVQPNLIMAIDDSGSMDFEVLLPGNDGSAWWRTLNASGNCTAATGRSFVGCIADGATDVPAAGRLNFNNGGNSSDTWRKYTYLFPNGLNSNNDSWQRRSGDNTNDHLAIPPLPDYAWARAHEYNAAFFNPGATYEPWINGGGYTFANS